MNVDFPRILTLLRKEKGISQKSAAQSLGISQALLSHYEKGIRECGLDFLVRCADFYGVSCDYLLGRSPDRQGSTLTVEDIPEAEGKPGQGIGSVLPTLNKKLIANALNILYDLLARAGNKSLVGEVSTYLMLAVYRMFRVLYAANPKNQEAMFQLPRRIHAPYADAAMQIAAANAESIAQGAPVAGMDKLKNTEVLLITTEGLAEQYPLYSSSLLNLVQTAENRIGYKEKSKKGN